MLPATLLVRSYANAHRRSVARLLGRPVPVPYRSGRGKGVLARVVIILRDPASWRDALWTLAHSVVGFVTACLSFTLLAGAVFYLVYPFLFWVTPDPVFREPFGDWYHLQSVAQSTVVWPLAALLFTLWWVLVIPLARAEVALRGQAADPARVTRPRPPTRMRGGDDAVDGTDERWPTTSSAAACPRSGTPSTAARTVPCTTRS